MGKLSSLRFMRWAKVGTQNPEYPNLEALVERESEKVADGFHLSRWIVPLSCTLGGTVVFLPLTLAVHPLFAIGVAAPTLIGGVLGGIFHLQAKKISPTQILLRKRCRSLANRLIGMSSLLGMTPTLSPKVASLLDEAAKAYLASPQAEAFGDGRKPAGVWDGARQAAASAMEEAMAQMLLLAEPATPGAQELELAQGWAQPLLEEMQATAKALARPASLSSAVQGAPAPLTSLSDARSQLERLGSAADELDELQERA